MAVPYFEFKPDTLKPTADTLRKQVDSLRVEKDDDDASLDQKIDYTAEDSIRIETENKKIYLFGNATVHYDNFDLKANYIEIDNNTHLITSTGLPDSNGVMQGNPEFKQGADQMKSEKMVYNFQTKKGKIYGLLTKQSEMYIYGEQVKKDSTNIMYLKRMKCIPCEYADAMIYFRASKAKIIPDDKIVTGPLFVEVSNIPLPLGLPFGFFPNVKKQESKWGIIIPSFGYSATQGFFLQSMGLFVPISNKLHMTLYGTYYSSGSWSVNSPAGGASSEPMFKYKVNYKYSGSLNIAFSHNVSGIPENHISGSSTAFSTSNNFRIDWKHTQDNKNNPTVRFSANVSVSTPNFGKLNNQSASMYLSSALLSTVSYAKTFTFGMINFGIRSSENLQTHSVQIDAPQLTFAANRMYPLKNSVPRTKNKWLDKLYIDYSFQSKISVNTYDSILFKQQGLDQIQYGWQQSIPIGTNINLFKYFTLTPSATFQQYTNFQTIEKTFHPYDTSITTMVRKDPKYAFAFDHSYQANISTKIYGDYLFRSKWLKQIRHQIIPTVGFSYHPDMQDKYNFYQKVQTGYDANNMPVYTYSSRFANALFGGPVGPENGSVNFNINNTLDAKIRQKTDTSVSYRKVALLQMLSIFGSYNVAAKTNKLSTINLTARTTLFKNIIGVNFTSIFDPYAANADGSRSTKFQYDVDKQLLRFTSYNLSLNGMLNNTQIKAFKDSKQPFSIGLSYNLLYTKNYNAEANNTNSNTKINEYNQNLSANFNLMPTPKWKITITTGYDFKAKNLSYTNFTIYRDLRCWEARVTWVPFGFAKQYMLTLNLKTTALRDMKVPKQKLWQDNL